MKKITGALLAITICSCTFITGCNKVDTEFSMNYVAGIMDASYKGEFNNYMIITKSSEEEAKTLYDTTVEYYTASIAYYCEIYTEDLSEELQNEFTEFTEDLLMKSKYTVASAESGNDSCYVRVSIKPINLLEQVEDDIKICINDFNSTLSEIGEENLQSLPEEEFKKLENDYASKVLDVLKEGSENLEYKDNIDFTIEIKSEDDVYCPVNEDDWNTIDDYVMGLF